MSSKLTNPKDMVGVRKAPISTVSTTALAEAAHAMAHLKHLRKSPLQASEAYDCAMSALLGWWEGAENFPLPQAHAIPTAMGTLILLRQAMILSANGKQGLLHDDRPQQGTFVPFYPQLNELAGKVIDVHADKNPRHFTIADSLHGQSVPPTVLPPDVMRTAPWHLLSGQVVAELGLAMLEGASKYGRHNYRSAGVRASVYLDATIRHLFSWWAGEDIDPDSGLSHITKAITSLTVLRDAQFQGLFNDDRAPRAACFAEAEPAPRTSTGVPLKIG
jgi:hypothetical protein